MLITEWNDDEYREVLLEEGREEGADQAMKDVARKMKEEGAEVSFIVKVTGKSEEEIAEL